MGDQRNVLGLIPARSGSEGVPGKHMKILGKSTLISYTFRSALQSTCLTKIVVSTDSLEIIKHTQEFPGVEVPFVRPAELALAQTPTLAVIQHAIKHYESAGQYFDYVCLLQPTTPFRATNLIDKTIAFLLENNADSLVTVRKTPTKYNPSWAFTIGKDNRLRSFVTDQKIISRRQNLPDTFYRDGQIYIVSTEMIKKGVLIDDTSIAFLNKSGGDVNIDTLEDWHQAERWLSNAR